MKSSKSRKPLISVVVLNYNGLKYLKQTIPSILKLNYPNYEVIIVDNGSDDGSINFLEKFKDINLIKNNKNWGYSRGKNTGVNEAQGKYLLLLDEDILVQDRNLLEKILNVYKTKDDIFNISLPLLNVGETATKYYGGFYSSYGLKEREKIEIVKILNAKKKLIEIGSPDGGALFVKTKDYLKVGGFDDSQPYFLDVGDYGIRGRILFGKNNYLYTKVCLSHLGTQRKENTRIWCWKYRYVFCGMSKIFFKNYKWVNIIKIYPVYILFIVGKTLKQLFKRKRFCVIFSLIHSMVKFIKDLPVVLRKRRQIQINRVVKHDCFLKISPPKFS